MFGFGAPLTFLIIVIALIISGIKILKEYERAVVFRLGRMVGARGPGITYIIPGVEKMVKMDLRTVTMDIPPQDVITRDNVSVKVNAVLYFRVLEPSRAVIVSCLEPVFAIVISAAVLGEMMRPLQIVGIVVVLAAIVMIQLPDGNRSGTSAIVEPIQ